MVAHARSESVKIELNAQNMCCVKANKSPVNYKNNLPNLPPIL